MLHPLDRFRPSWRSKQSNEYCASCDARLRADPKNSFCHPRVRASVTVLYAADPTVGYGDYSQRTQGMARKSADDVASRWEGRTHGNCDAPWTKSFHCWPRRWSYAGVPLQHDRFDREVCTRRLVLWAFSPAAARYRQENRLTQCERRILRRIPSV